MQFFHKDIWELLPVPINRSIWIHSILLQASYGTGMNLVILSDDLHQKMDKGNKNLVAIDADSHGMHLEHLSEVGLGGIILW